MRPIDQFQADSLRRALVMRDRDIHCLNYLETGVLVPCFETTEEMIAQQKADIAFSDEVIRKSTLALLERTVELAAPLELR